MAEELAKNPLGLMGLKLRNCLKSVKQTITVDPESTATPSETLLNRQVTHLKAAWEEYKEGMLRMREVAAPENMASYKDQFEKAHSEFHNNMPAS